MNVNIENLEKRKKIVVICLSGALIFITLIAGLFIIKKNNKKDSFESNDIGEVVDENNDNDKVNKNDNNDKDNEGAIINENNYFFNKRSGQITINILSFLITGILLFFWENDKLSADSDNYFLCADCKKELFLNDNNDYMCFYGFGSGKKKEGGLLQKKNWFGLGTFVSLIVITFLVEFILNYLLLGSITHLFSKDKSKRYFHTLKMSWKKRMYLFSSFSKTKTFFVAFSYLLYGFVIAIVARMTFRRLKPCCCCDNGEIVTNHSNSCFCFDNCFGFCDYDNKEEKKEIPSDISINA